jgi:nitroreductase
MRQPDHPTTAIEAIRLRRSVRGFLPAEVDNELLHTIFEIAQMAPSNCNTQPWQTVVVSGQILDQLKRAWQEAAQDASKFLPDFPYSGRYEGIFKARQHEAAANLYQAMGIGRGDSVQRAASALRNFACFDAPHVALIYLPAGMSVREAGDCGMYAQTLMLTLTQYGLSSCPQTSLSFYPKVVRSLLDIPDDWQLLMGISFGYEDPNVSANQCRVGRDPVSKCVRFFE